MARPSKAGLLLVLLLIMAIHACLARDMLDKPPGKGEDKGKDKGKDQDSDDKDRDKKPEQGCGNACQTYKTCLACTAECRRNRCCWDGAACVAINQQTAGRCKRCGGDDCNSLSNVLTAARVNGLCAITACRTGFADCDKSAANGCEVDVRSTAGHCGRCNNACNMGGAIPGTCSNGVCSTPSCPSGFGDCNRNAADGCEVNLNTNATNCGACGTTCTTGANAQPATCSGGTCSALTCLAGFANCNGDAADGCEVNTNTNTTNCGSCGTTCSTGANAEPATCSGGTCSPLTCLAGFANCNGDAADGCEVNINTNTTNCGGCGTSCTTGANAQSATCAGGTCSSLTCLTGFADCNSDATDGCEVNMNTNATNCGACGTTCSTGANAEPATCSSGTCSPLTCLAGFANCNGDAADGCEVNVKTNTTNCGACGTTCSTGPNAEPATCVNGTCSPLTCLAGFADCNGDVADGCEVNLNTNTTNCGACGTTCSTGPNAQPATCAEGICSALTCLSGFADCNGDAPDGCEVDLNTNATNCGGCGTTCSTGANAEPATCSGGTCSPLTCLAGFANCNENASDGCEVNLNATAANCGSCGTSCSTGANAEPATCSGGTCLPLTCLAGFANCNGDATDGCEVNLNTAATSCGSCSTTCTSGANAEPATCSGGTCSPLTCLAGFANCNGDTADGCEVNLNTNATNCGACGTTCITGPNAQPATCVNGTCSPLTCLTGFADCNGDAADGCEVNINTNATNCGACGTACTTGANGQPATCSGGTCSALTCLDGFADCNGISADGCEVNLNTSATNCGACNNTCLGKPNTSGGTCSNGTCSPICSAGYGNCNGRFSDGCETWTDANIDNCGACGNNCTQPPNAVRNTCARGFCSTTFFCLLGFGNCNDDTTDGCEVNLNTSTTNCGACGISCLGKPNTSGGSCSSGTCSPICSAGYGNCNGQSSDGCEVNLNTNTTNCGACGTTCSTRPNAEPATCINGVCAPMKCLAGFADCNSNVADGCEVNLNTNAANCGTCGISCLGKPNTVTVGSASGACTAGTCVLNCLPNFANCDRLAGNGCEVNLKTSSTSCGSCGNSCLNRPWTNTDPSTVTGFCSSGTCVLNCLSGRGDCDGTLNNGCEVDLQSTRTNCGYCGISCLGKPNTSGGECFSGTCRPVCMRGYGDCNQNYVDGCEVTLGTTTNCRTCGNQCGFAEFCSNYQCSFLGLG